MAIVQKHNATAIPRSFSFQWRNHKRSSVFWWSRLSHTVIPLTCPNVNVITLHQLGSQETSRWPFPVPTCNRLCWVSKWKGRGKRKQGRRVRFNMHCWLVLFWKSNCFPKMKNENLLDLKVQWRFSPVTRKQFLAISWRTLALCGLVHTVCWWMPLAMCNNFAMPIQRFSHLISAQALNDKSVMVRSDSSLPCGARLPLWPNTINAPPSQEEESNCLFCRYSTLRPTRSLIIYTCSCWAFPVNRRAILKCERLNPTHSSPADKFMQRHTNWIYIFILKGKRESSALVYNAYFCLMSWRLTRWFCIDVVSGKAVARGRMLEFTCGAVE